MEVLGISLAQLVKAGTLVKRLRDPAKEPLGASFVDVKQLREAIDHSICAYNEQAAPFEWRQIEIKQQPLRDDIAYFDN
jgi:hypothetical protein